MGSIPANVSFPDDPSGSGRGKVVRFRYVGSGSALDLNLAVNFAPNGLSLGSNFFFSGDLYFPAGTANWTNGWVQRKLLYFKREGGDPRLTFFVLKLNGNEGYVTWSKDGGDTFNHPLDQSFSLDRWYRVETQVRMNSTMAAPDGIIRVWIDGVLKYEDTAVRFTNPSWSGDVSWKYWWFGMQREGTDTGGGAPEPSIDEMRYWDNVEYGTKRIRR